MYGLLAPWPVPSFTVGSKVGQAEVSLARHPLHGDSGGRWERLPFLVGTNYVGAADRAWAMWEETRFDPALIEADFGRAASLGLNCIRLFVQEQLSQDIRRNRWDRLDLVIDLAERHRLLVLVTLGDYDETLLTVQGFEAGQVARRYTGRQHIIGYNLRNEPQFRDLCLAIYPTYPVASAPVLQGPLLIETYGERSSRAVVEASRKDDPYWLPSRLTAEEGYRFANNVRIYNESRPDILRWLRNSPAVSLSELLARPDSPSHWTVLLRATDEAMQRWTAALAGPIRQADPVAWLTVGHNDLLLASLPANASLDFVSLHIYPPGDDSAPTTSVDSLASLAARHGLPAMLGEFGWPTSEFPADRVAALQTATFRELRRRGMLGGLQWMLTDIAGAEETREGSFGLFSATGQPKPPAAAIKAVAAGG